MKKTLAILLALLLCLSFCFVACDNGETKATDPKPTEKPTDAPGADNGGDSNGDSNGDGNNVPSNPEEPEIIVSKDVIINSISDIDLPEILASVLEGDNEAMVEEMIGIFGGAASGNMGMASILASVGGELGLNAGANVVFTEDGENYNTSISLKGDLLYSKNSEGNYTDETIIYLGGDAPVVFFKGADGEWTITSNGDEPEADIGPGVEVMPNNPDDRIPVPYEAVDEEMEQPDYLQMIKDMAAQVTVPALTAEYLTEKDGMLVLSNDYIVKIFVENDQFIESNLTPEEIEEGAELAKKTLNDMGLEIAFGGNDKSVTKITVKLAPTAELTKEMGIKSASLVAESTADAAQLKKITFETEIADGRFEDDSTAKAAFSIETILDSKNAIVGAKISVESFNYSAMADLNNDINSDRHTEHMTVRKYVQKIDMTLDLSQMKNINETVLDFTLTQTLVRMADLDRVVVGDDYENATTTLVKEYSAAEMAEEDDAKNEFKITAKSTSASGIKFTGNVDEVTFTGDADFSTAFNFPSELPEIVTEYIESQQAE